MIAIRTTSCTLGQDVVGASQLLGMLTMEVGCLEQLVSRTVDLTTPLEGAKLF